MGRKDRLSIYVDILSQALITVKLMMSTTLLLDRQHYVSWFHAKFYCLVVQTSVITWLFQYITLVFMQILLSTLVGRIFGLPQLKTAIFSLTNDIFHSCDIHLQ